jgi:hypothetical protein
MSIDEYDSFKCSSPEGLSHGNRAHWPESVFEEDISPAGRDKNLCLSWIRLYSSLSIRRNGL